MAAPMGSFDWTDAAMAQLKELHAAGFSAREIAERLGEGATRGAVIGKANRLGLSSSTKSSVTRLARKEERKQEAASPKAEDPKGRPTGAVAATAALGSTHCRWPIGDPQEASFHYCMSLKPLGQPYCERHRKRSAAAIQPGPKKRRAAA